MTDHDASVEAHLAAFAYRTSKDGKVFITWGGKPIMTLKGAAAGRFAARMEQSSEAEQRLHMAKLTGNFKHGNERAAKGAKDRR
jgi:hypothetical protein